MTPIRLFVFHVKHFGTLAASDGVLHQKRAVIYFKGPSPGAMRRPLPTGRGSELAPKLITLSPTGRGSQTLTMTERCADRLAEQEQVGGHREAEYRERYRNGDSNGRRLADPLAAV